ncbi:MAG: hypothetical protein AAF211_09760 [Myxococcota bacterium]
MHPGVFDGAMTRRTWLSVAAGTLVAATTVRPGVALSDAPLHPAIPARVLDGQIDAAVREAIAWAAPRSRAAVAAVAHERFGAPTSPAVYGVPAAVRTAVHAVITRG